ncbi:(d)CMP kinase [Chlorobium phaeovibrioides]|uniref:Cytidylate kinase n=1 Tax=Chlorobium phaeovibrioides TaxID=1094 RepID=A0A5M8I8S8_CHLPH|nr:(d)CMP kinase [Chlorobium phaeovibrioides]KAA6230655.1 (d)CMP kinase [Chlorobium phaeovibrioides]
MQARQLIGRKKIIIAIDGPAASGKSTTARKVAGLMGYTYIDTGAMYRSVTLKVIESGMLDEVRRSPEKVEGLVKGISIAFEGDRVLLDGRDVSGEIRDNRVAREVSFISSLKPVRDALLVMQQELGRGRGVVMDGRDIGTVVFPDAELKIFLVADARERAKRRHLELQAKSPEGFGVPDLETLEAEIVERDRVDALREHAPLKKHPDAKEIDTSRLNIEEQVAMVHDFAVQMEEGGR